MAPSRRGLLLGPPRGAWSIEFLCLIKSKKKKRAEVSVKTIQEFKDEIGLIRGLEGDNEFSSAPQAIKSFVKTMI
jgi:hypothetical protein